MGVYHVVSRGGQWCVVKTAARRSSGTFATKQAAVRRARQLAQASGVAVLVHGPDGGIVQEYPALLAR